ncbi:MAG: ABC transporter permease subunit [Peptococcaceae bacterium]|jgi:NitT/TauT family transport system permease protein|nr:ABC transporter permease subunit [Peptococcaceae bacterium]
MKNLLRVYLCNIPNALFLLLLILVAAIPGRLAERSAVKPAGAFLVLILAAELFYLIRLRGANKRAAKDVAAFVFSLLIAWELVTAKLDALRYIFLPPPENVFYVYVEQGRVVLGGFGRSMLLLTSGFFSALFLGVLLGIIIGSTRRLRDAVFPIVKAISTVPALIYTPYVVVLMPTFASASVLVIFLGIFWSTLMNTINDVGTVDQRILDSAKILNVKVPVMVHRVLLPYLLPRIINSLTVQLTVSVMTLTAAEMIGANVGMGYFVRRSLDYANYAQALAGIFFIAVVISALNALILRLKKRVVKWRY